MTGIYTKAKKIVRKEKGAALVTVMIIFTVIMIVSASLMTLLTSNLKQSKHQEYKTQAYYLALSGIDLGLSALMQKDAGNKTLLDDFKWDEATYPPPGGIVNDLAYKEAHISPLTDVIHFGSDTVTLTITAINTDGKREVKLQAVGLLYDSNVSYTLTLIIDADNPTTQRWE
jgi:hypothetical protein